MKGGNYLTIHTDDLVENSLSIVIPLTFIIDKTDLTWGELYFGVQCGFIHPEAAIQKAEKLIAQEVEISASLFELASLFKHEAFLAVPYLSNLAEQEPMQSITFIQEKWLYLVLSWLYEHQEEHRILKGEEQPPLDNAFQQMMVIWDDFNSNMTIFDFILKQDTTDPLYFEIAEEPIPVDLSNLYQGWERFLKEQEKRFQIW